MSYAMDGVPIGENAKRTLFTRFRNQWDKWAGCTCASVATQGGIHSLCVLFAGVSGAGASGASRYLSVLFQGNGVAGLTAAETFQYLAAPVLSIPLSYGIDKIRKSPYTLSKAAIALTLSAGVAVGIASQWPHDHNGEMARVWFESQTAEQQEQIKRFAKDTGQTVDEVALGLCSSNPKIQAEMDRLKTPAYLRVAQYIGMMR